MHRSRRALLAVVALAALAAGACGRGDDSSGAASASSVTVAGGGSAQASSTTADACTGQQLQATEVGVSESTITIEVMADVGSPLAPGLFQGNIDGVKAWADRVNRNGGIACRKVAVRTWDSKLSPDESTNGFIDGCKSALAMVGGNALFTPNVKVLGECADQAGQPSGLPDMAALIADPNELCAPTSFVVQSVQVTCPVQPGVAPSTQLVGGSRWLSSQHPGLHGVFLVPGDLPTTIIATLPGMRAQQQVAGIGNDGEFKVSGRDEQPAYLRFLQAVKQKGSNYVYVGSNDVAMVKMRKEARAQGIDAVKVWSCALTCYTASFLSTGGADVEGTYLTLQSLPFEEADTNPEIKAYLDGVGGFDKATSWGAQAWQAGIAFQQAVDNVVKRYGVNGITRAHLLEGLRSITSFDANGWIGPKSLKGTAPCFLVMQVHNGHYERVYPQQKGTFDCKPENLATIQIDPVAEGGKLS